MASLKDFMAPDPEEGRRAGLAAVLPHSGFAAPVLAYQLGKSQRAGEEFQKAETERAKGAYGDYNMQQYADQFIEKVFKLAEKDPVAATQMLQVEVSSGQNKYLSNFKGMQFNGAEGGKVLFTDGGGQSWLVNRAKAGSIMEKGGSFEDAVRAGYATKVGEPKAPAGGATDQRAASLNAINDDLRLLANTAGRSDIMLVIAQAEAQSPGSGDNILKQYAEQAARGNPARAGEIQTLAARIKQHISKWPADKEFLQGFDVGAQMEALGLPTQGTPGAAPAALVPQPAPATSVPSPRQVVQGMAPLDALAAEKARRGLR